METHFTLCSLWMYFSRIMLIINQCDFLQLWLYMNVHMTELNMRCSLISRVTTYKSERAKLLHHELWDVCEAWRIIIIKKKINFINPQQRNYFPLTLHTLVNILEHTDNGHLSRFQTHCVFGLIGRWTCDPLVKNIYIYSTSCRLKLNVEPRCVFFTSSLSHRICWLHDNIPWLLLRSQFKVLDCIPLRGSTPLNKSQSSTTHWPEWYTSCLTRASSPDWEVC